jgi:hypothetical protein
MTVDIVIDDIKLESASFIPDSIRVVQKNDLRFTQGSDPPSDLNSTRGTGISLTSEMSRGTMTSRRSR